MSAFACVIVCASGLLMLLGGLWMKPNEWRDGVLAGGASMMGVSTVASAVVWMGVI